MFPWGAIVSLAGSAVSGIASAINNRKAKEANDKEYARQQAELTARAYEDPVSRSENQQMLNEYDRRARKEIENQTNTGIITGETQEAALARQKAAMEGRADMMSNMAAGASARKDTYLDAVEQSKREQNAAEQARLAARNQTYANLAANAASAFGNIVDSYGTPQARLGNIQTQSTATKQNNAKVATGTGTTSTGQITQAANLEKLNTAMAGRKFNSNRQVAFTYNGDGFQGDVYADKLPANWKNMSSKQLGDYVIKNWKNVSI